MKGSDHSVILALVLIGVDSLGLSQRNVGPGCKRMAKHPEAGIRAGARGRPRPTGSADASRWTRNRGDKRLPEFVGDKVLGMVALSR